MSDFTDKNLYTVEQVFSISESLQSIVQEDMDAITSFKLSMNLQIVKPVAEAFESSRKKLIMSVLGSDGIGKNGQYHLTPEQRDAVNNQLKPLLDYKINLSGLNKISLSELSHLKISIASMMGLSSIIED